MVLHCLLDSTQRPGPFENNYHFSLHNQALHIQKTLSPFYCLVIKVSNFMHKAAQKLPSYLYPSFNHIG